MADALKLKQSEGGVVNRPEYQIMGVDAPQPRIMKRKLIWTDLGHDARYHCTKPWERINSPNQFEKKDALRITSRTNVR